MVGGHSVFVTHSSAGGVGDFSRATFSFLGPQFPNLLD